MGGRIQICADGRIRICPDGRVMICTPGAPCECPEGLAEVYAAANALDGGIFLWTEEDVPQLRRYEYRLKPGAVMEKVEGEPCFWFIDGSYIQYRYKEGESEWTAWDDVPDDAGVEVGLHVLNAPQCWWFAYLIFAGVAGHKDTGNDPTGVFEGDGTWLGYKEYGFGMEVS